MSSTDQSAANGTPLNPAGLTDKETQLLGYAWLCFKSQPEVDMTKLTELAGYTNPGSTRNALAKAKGKILKAAGVDPATIKKAPAKRKAGASAAASKRQKTGAKGKAAMSAPLVDDYTDSDDDMDVAVKSEVTDGVQGTDEEDVASNVKMEDVKTEQVKAEDVKDEDEPEVVKTVKKGKLIKVKAEKRAGQ